MATLINHRAGYYSATHNKILGKDAHGNARIQTIRVVLKPGANDVDDEQWKLVRENPRVKARIESMEIEVLDELKGGAPVELSQLPPQRAQTAARETVDLDLLRSWLEVEKRQPVRQVIVEQISKISPDKSDDDTGRRGRGRRGAA